MTREAARGPRPDNRVIPPPDPVRMAGELLRIGRYQAEKIGHLQPLQPHPVGEGQAPPHRGVVRARIGRGRIEHDPEGGTGDGWSEAAEQVAPVAGRLARQKEPVTPIAGEAGAATDDGGGSHSPEVYIYGRRAPGTTFIKLTGPRGLP